MLLLGERDIYDFAVGRDTDKRYTYTRTAFDLSQPSGSPKHPYMSTLRKYSFELGWKSWSKRELEPVPAFFIFCGSIYHCSLLPTGQVVWKSEDILRYANEVDLQFVDRTYLNSDYHIGITSQNLDEFLAPKKLTKDVNEWLIENKVVQAFLVKRKDDREVKWWPNTNAVKAIGFNKVMDPTLIYQEIEQYVTSELVSEIDNMVVLNDTHKRNKAGFDDKSFKHRK